MISLDIGFGHVKCVCRNGHGLHSFKFPSAVSYAEDGDFLDGVAQEKEYEYGAEKYVIGESAVRRSGSTQSYSFMKKYSPLLAFAAIEMASARDESFFREIALGFPLSFHREHSKAMSAEFREITVNGKTLCLVPHFYAQGYGVLADYRINDKYLVRPGTDQNLLIVDIGFNTVDILCADKGRAVKTGAMTLDHQGVSKITDRIRKKLLSEHKIYISDQEAVSILNDGYFEDHSRRRDFSAELRDMTRRYAEALFMELEAKWGDHLRVSKRIILAGGGAYIVKDYVSSKYQSMVSVPAEPEYANARGYLKIMTCEAQDKGRDANA